MTTTSSETQLAPAPVNALDVQAGRYTREDLDVLKRTVAKDTNDTQFKLFLQVVARTKLDPFAKQIYAIVRRGEMAIQTGIDGFRLIAERSGEYEGQTPPEWCGPDGVWKQAWLSHSAPTAARVGVYRRGFREPVWGVARMASYASDGPMWRKMPEAMLVKCAEALALRKAFPLNLAGLYADEEMEQAGRANQPMEVAQPPVRPRVSEVIRKPVANVAAAAATPVYREEEAAATSAPTPAPEAPDAPPAADAGGPGEPFNEDAFWLKLEEAARTSGLTPSALGAEVTANLNRKGYATLADAPPAWRAKLLDHITNLKTPAPAAAK